MDFVVIFFEFYFYSISLGHVCSNWRNEISNVNLYANRQAIKKFMSFEKEYIAIQCP